MRINRIYGIMLVILLASCSEAKSSKRAIRIGVPPSTNFMQVFVADKEQFFNKNGIDGKVVTTEKIRELYSEKELDVICTGLTESILFSTEGHETKIIYRFTNSFTTDLIIASPNVKNLSSLKGKKISFQGINTSSHIFIQQLLKQNEIQDGDYLAVNLPVNKVMKALREGKIDAGHVTGISPSEVVKQGFHVIGKSSDIPDLLSDTLSVDVKYLKNNEKELKLLVQSIDAANYFYPEEENKHEEKDRKRAISLTAQIINKTELEIEEEINGLRFLTLANNRDALHKPTIEHLDQLTTPAIKLNPLGDKLNMPIKPMTNKAQNKKSSLFTAGETIIEFLKDRGQIYRNPVLNSIIDDSFVKELEVK